VEKEEMISLSLNQTIEAEKTRQIEDLKICNRLWDIYEKNTTLMSVLRQMCAVGAGISLEWLKKCAEAVNEPDLDKFCEVVFRNPRGSKLLDEVKNMDCFEGKSPTRAKLEDMQKRPEVCFRDMGKIGGWFRVQAELSEHMCTFILDQLGLRRDPDIDALMAKARFETFDNPLVTKYLKLIAGAPKAPKSVRDKHRIQLMAAILDREYEGRLSHQTRLVQRYLKGQGTTPGGRKYKIYAYTAEWFAKWQYKGDTAARAYQAKLEEVRGSEYELQRARRSESNVPIPRELRPYIKVPSHKKSTININNDSDWQFAGITKWRQMEWDRLWQISQLYGLPRGATISGTTTDHQFAIYEILTRVESIGTGDNVRRNVENAVHMKGLAERIQMFLPYIHLIPVIQMGAQMHHSVCEMGTALSLNDFIDYHVGYYTTLLPSAGAGMKVYSSTFDQAVRRALADAEARVTHLYAISENKRKGMSPTAHAAWACSNDRDRARHKARAAINPETAHVFEQIPFDHGVDFILKKAKEIDSNIR